jgi:hypothetical protein
VAAPTSLGGIALGSAGEALAFGLGFALGRVLEPVGTGLVQEAWSQPGAAIKALDHTQAAAIVAEGLKTAGWGESEGTLSGFDAERFDLVVQELLKAPGFGELLRMLRRQTITPEQFEHGLRKAKLETLWNDAVAELQHERLDPAVIATSIQRGIMRDPGYLPVDAPTAVGVIEPMPVSPLDPAAEAAAGGVDEERLAVMTRIVGLPPSPGELLQLVNRGVIQPDDFARGIAEGNTRNEWAAALLELRRAILSPSEYAELRVRGWIDDGAMHAGAALHGMETADVDLLFRLHGRPIPTHQVTTGLARGGTYNGDSSAIPEAYLRSLEEGSQRPEWYSLSYANRYTYPSAFVLRALAQAGDLTGEQTHAILLEIGWRPDLAQLVADRWTGGTTAAADKHVTKAENELWTALHRAYVVNDADDQVAASALTALGVAQPSQAPVLALWKHERELVRLDLTPTQVKKAYSEARFTVDVATARLEQLGMSPADAATFLAE